MRTFSHTTQTILSIVFASLLIGCQSGGRVTHQRLIEHQALIDFSGLKPAERIPSVQVQCAVPQEWETMPLKKTALYAHQQWRSPSTHSGAGVIHVRLPFPLSERAVVWFAKREYTRRSSDGRLIAQWNDSFGRSWFDAQNSTYRVRGYVTVRGFRAWIVYFGYKTAFPPNLAEISLAARCVDSILPAPEIEKEDLGITTAP